VSTQSAATDPRTGTIDMDMITTGRGALDRDGIHALANEVRAMLEDSGAKGRRMPVAEVRRNMARQSGQ
jgi:DNA replication licensing factor MCM4